jgi:hypothetical protein
LKKSIVSKLSSTLKKRGYILTKATSPKKLKRFLSTLQPRRPQTPLIRLGSLGDGGYLIPEDLIGISACFSPGVGTLASFEADLIALDIPCYMADASVSEAPIDTELAHFIPKYISSKLDPKHISLSQWVADSGKKGDLLLQMDIEGGEFDVIIHSDESLLKRFRIMVIEFHNFHYLHNAQSFELYTQIFNKLTKNHSLVHAHVNNYSDFVEVNGIRIPPLMEFTFLRNDRFAEGTLENYENLIHYLPNNLDSDNVSKKKHLAFPIEWFGYGLPGIEK